MQAMVLVHYHKHFLTASDTLLQIPGGVTAPKGFKAAGIYGGLRAKGDKPDLSLVTCEVDAVVAGECIYFPLFFYLRLQTTAVYSLSSYCVLHDPMYLNK